MLEPLMLLTSSCIHLSSSGPVSPQSSPASTTQMLQKTKQQQREHVILNIVITVDVRGYESVQQDFPQQLSLANIDATPYQLRRSP
jgi:hypothetical protein